MFYIYHRGTAIPRLARKLGVEWIYPYEWGDTPLPIYRPGVNWGCVRIIFDESSTINWNISIASSKVRTFEALDRVGVRHPPIFSSIEDAKRYEYGYLARRDGLSGGRGIEIVPAGGEPSQEWDFLVGIVPCLAEYRIHICKEYAASNYRVLATQQKIGVRDATTIIHNHSSGVTFSLQSLNMSESGIARASSMAIAAVESCHLDFGAVDIMQGLDRKLYVLEVNTAPGIRTDSLFARYLDYFQGELNEH